MQKITTFLMFSSGGAEAMDFYTKLFKNSKVHSKVLGPDGKSLINGSFSLDGYEINAYDGGEYFKFTEGISLFVDCKDQAEVDYYWNGFIEGGGTKSMCGWLTDKWGVSWQIIPKVLMEYMGDPDPKKAQATMQAMLKMNKIIIKDLQEAYDKA